MKLQVPALAWVAAAAVAGFAFFAWRRGGIAPAAQAIGGAAVEAAGGLVGGVVQGIGDAVGVQRTEESACDLALREGRLWDASFACPAGRFVSGAWASMTEPSVDGEVLDAMDARARRGTGAGQPASAPPDYIGQAIEGGQIWWPSP